LKILLAPHGTRGDVQPMIALARGLRARGHFVRFVAPGNFVDWIRQRGFACDSDGIDVEAALKSGKARLQSIRHQIAYLRDELAPHLFDTVPRAAAGADLVVGAGVQIAGASAAELHRIPYVSAIFCPCAVPNRGTPPPTVRAQTLPRWINRLLWRMGTPLADAALRGPINAGRARIGLRPSRRPLRQIAGGGAVLAADRELAPFAGERGTKVTQTDAWILEDARPVEPRIDAFLRAGTPPIYVGFGSMVPGEGAEVASILISAARALGRRAIVSEGWASLRASEGADDILSIGDAPHAALFPRVAAVVHHGGAGTTTAAARAGVPQVVIPHLLDQFYWAHRVATLGLGPSAVPIDRMTADAVADRLRDAIGVETYAANARAMAARIEPRNGVDAAVKHLETLDPLRHGQPTYT